MKFLFELEPTKKTDNFYLYVHAMQQPTQYQLVPDLELTKRLLRHIFTSLLHEGYEASSAAHSRTEVAVAWMQLLGLSTALDMLGCER